MTLHLIFLSNEVSHLKVNQLIGILRFTVEQIVFFLIDEENIIRMRTKLYTDIRSRGVRLDSSLLHGR